MPGKATRYLPHQRERLYRLIRDTGATTFTGNDVHRHGDAVLLKISHLMKRDMYETHSRSAGENRERQSPCVIRYFAFLTLHFALCVISTSSLAGAELPGPDLRTYQQTIQPLLEKHCFRCHGERKQEAELRVDRLGLDMLEEKTAEIWHELINRVNSGEMPPKKEPQLSTTDLNQLTEWVAGGLKRVAAASQTTGGRVVIRRLNRQEYNNTICDLVGIPFDAGEDFPDDPAAFGFDNIGSALSVSPLHMEKYLLAARKVIDRAIVTGEQPKRERWRIQAERRSKEDRGYYFENDAKYGNTGVYKTREEQADRGRRILWALGDGSPHFPSDEYYHLPPVEKTRFNGGVLRGIDFTYPVSGEYIIRVRAYGHYFNRQMSKHYLYGPPRLNVTSNGLPVLTCDVPAVEAAPEVYETRFYTESLTTNIYIRNRYDYSLSQIYQQVGSIGRNNPELPIPYLAVDWYEIDGPVYDAWPPESHTRILFASEHRPDEEVYAREVLASFATRAFRRPARVEEIDRLVDDFKRARPKKESFEEAIKVPLVAVLCSPSILFLSEPTALAAGSASEEALHQTPDASAFGSRASAFGSRALNDYELASRLSYFLWSSMPDDELFKLAGNGKLREAGVLETQVLRMLKHSRSRALVDNFTGQWLSLRKLGEVVPDDGLFPLYGEHLESSMAGEASSFFAEVLDHDLSVMNFIDSDFVMLNERLARFYEIQGIQGDHFRKVPLKPEYHRGGRQR
jgi:mono/diheme cytochrome c family protein